MPVSAQIQVGVGQIAGVPQERLSNGTDVDERREQQHRVEQRQDAQAAADVEHAHRRREQDARDQESAEDEEQPDADRAQWRGSIDAGDEVVRHHHHHGDGAQPIELRQIGHS
jgi:hypothetical protein